MRCWGGARPISMWPGHWNAPIRGRALRHPSQWNNGCTISALSTHYPPAARWPRITLKLAWHCVCVSVRVFLASARVQTVWYEAQCRRTGAGQIGFLHLNAKKSPTHWRINVTVPLHYCASSVPQEVLKYDGGGGAEHMGGMFSLTRLTQVYE